MLEKLILEALEEILALRRGSASSSQPEYKMELGRHSIPLGSAAKSSS